MTEKLPSGREPALCENYAVNAAEACARMTGGARFVRVGSHLQHGVLTLAVDNSFEGNLRQKDGVFLSSKRKGEGIGTASVAAVARKYGGSAQFEKKRGLFQASVYVRVEQK
ncbi:GHKL domain-containing protein [Oscillibacter sp. GMB15532]|uniref:GHKL domain-containing protein n=1 Tax=Oscillibacter sp. GMB15532 TaxID=3230022 RepID=UPI0034DF8CDE